MARSARDIGLLAIRVGVGGTLFAHGAQKLFGWFGGGGIDATATMFDSIGFTPGKANAYAAGLGEAGGGALIALGLATPAAGAAVAGTMAVAASMHADNGFFAQGGGLEYPAVLGLVAGALALTGPGELSVDAVTGHNLNRSWMRTVALASVPPAVTATILRRRQALKTAAALATTSTEPARLTDVQLGIYSFGSLERNPGTGELATTAQATRNLLEAVRLADEVGLDYFGIGEHHTEQAPASSAATILAAAASVTSRILLGSAVTVLSTDDPVRVYQQFATLDAVSNGRAEITAGRGSSTESFPLFGYNLRDYHVLYREKLDLLLNINRNERVTWSGTTRSALHDAVIVPRPDRGHLPIWLGTGGSPDSSIRAGQLGLPISYGIIGGQPERFAAHADAYREAYAAAGHPVGGDKVAIGNPGFLAPHRTDAQGIFWDGWNAVMLEVGQERGFAPPNRAQFEAETTHGALFVGDPEQIAERILRLHTAVGHMRHFLQMDIGPTPHRDILTSIELLGTKVKPLIDAELGPEPADLRATVVGV